MLNTKNNMAKVHYLI